MSLRRQKEPGQGMGHSMIRVSAEKAGQGAAEGQLIWQPLGIRAVPACVVSGPRLIEGRENIGSV